MAATPCLLATALVLLLIPGPALAETATSCGPPRQGTPLASTSLLRPANQPAPEPALDYRHRLHTTAHGWPIQSTWCVWVEPAETPPPAPSTRWLEAVAGALEEWRSVVAVQLVPSPEQAHITLWRRRPPLGQDRDGRPRASHGRAVLSLLGGGGSPPARVEPQVRVLISPEQRFEAIQATALHELGHAFGLWGHSDDPADAMAVSPGSRPILRLSGRDRATIRWLYSQPSPMGSTP
ncbi:MAG: peptidase [Cyanobacteriota bacterium]|nr:peptidase [Cyanobacteriota bacterium]